MTSKSRIIANSGRYVNTDGTPKLGGNITLTTIDGQVSASIERDSTEASVISYSSIDSLPISNLITGTIAFVEDINSIYITDGSGWFSIATVNQTPTISSGVGSAFNLAIDGTPTIITITASDPEGIPLTYTATPDSDFAGLATLSQDSSVFTITPLSEDSATTTSASITFAVSDGVNVAGGVNTFTLFFRSPYWSDVVLNLGTSDTNGLQNDTFVDKSGNSIPITKYNTPYQTSFHPYLDNWSVKFDASSIDYLEIDGNGVNLLGAADFTIEAWVYLTEPFATVNTRGIMSQYPGSGASGNQWILGFRENKVVVFPVVGTSVFSTNDIQFNTWHHVAWTRSGSTNYLFLDGNLEATFTNSADYSGLTTSADQFEIGTWGGGDVNTWGGYISNARIVKGTALYTTTFTPPTEPLTAISGTVILACNENRFGDFSGTHTLTPLNTPEISSFNPFGQDAEFALAENKGSGYFSTNEYLRADTALDQFTTTTESFTIEFWAYPFAISSSVFIIGMNRASDGANTFLVGLDNFYINGTQINYNETVNAYEWTHFAVTFAPSEVRIYINGVLSNVQSNITTAPSSCVLGIGAEFDAADGGTPGNYYDGYISDFSIVPGLKYTGAFTPPVAPVDPTGAAFYLPFDNAGIFDKTGNNALTLFGNTVATTSQTKYATTSVYFDGTGDGVSIATDSKFVYGTGDFTIECWVYLNATGDFGIFGHGDGNVANLYLYIATTTPTVFFNNTSVATGPALSTGAWTHLAVTRTNNTLRVFTNGIAGTAIADATNLTAGGPITIGMASNNAQVLNGYIENLQVIKGVAKYLANFTPPAQTQGYIYQATGLPINTLATAITDISAFEATSPEAGWYYIQPTGASSTALVEYSGPNFKGSGKGYFRWWRSVDIQAPTINHYGLSWQFDEMLVDLEGVEYQDVIFNSAQTFNQRNSNDVADGGSRAGYRVYFGFAGGHGIYNTTQGTCNWGDGTGSIGAGYDGSCGSFPSSLIIGTGQTGTAIYANRGNTISFWFRW